MQNLSRTLLAAALTAAGALSDPHFAIQLSWEGRTRNEQAIEQTLIQSGWLTPADPKTAMRPLNGASAPSTRTVK